jgi:glycogen phosphorylase
MDGKSCCETLDTETELLQALERRARHLFAKRWKNLTPTEIYNALSLAVRDCMVDGLIETEERYSQSETKRVYYLSIEFLPGRLLYNNLQNMGMLPSAAGH